MPIHDDGFIRISFNYANLDRYMIRTHIKKAIDQALPLFKGQLLDVGCGKMPYKAYIMEKNQVLSYCGLDLETALTYSTEIRPDFTWDGIVMPFESSSFDTVIATEVLEHCMNPDAVMAEVYRVLHPTGWFFFTVPFLWNLHEVPNDAYRYTPFSLQSHLEKTGFKDISIFPTGGWHASLAQLLGMWVKRAPMHRWLRKVSTFMIKPLMKGLIKYDKNFKVAFTEGQMITGLYGWARK